MLPGFIIICKLEIGVYVTVKIRNPETYLGPCQATIIEFFCANCYRLTVVNCFCKKTPSEMFGRVPNTDWVESRFLMHFVFCTPRCIQERLSEGRINNSYQSPYPCLARSKARKPRKYRKSRKFFSKIFKSDFPFWLQGKTENWEIRKLGITFPRFSRFPTFLSFRLATFSFSFLIYFPLF